MAAIHRRRRHAELNSQASTQGCNTLRLTYAHSHRGSAISHKSKRRERSEIIFKEHHVSVTKTAHLKRKLKESQMKVYSEVRDQGVSIHRVIFVVVDNAGHESTRSSTFAWLHRLAHTGKSIKKIVSNCVYNLECMYVFMYFVGTFASSSSSSLTFNVTRMQYVNDHTLFTPLRQYWTVPKCQNDIWLFDLKYN